MDQQPTDVETELTYEQVFDLFNEWYRRPTYVITSGEFQVVNREKLMAASRTFHRLFNERNVK